MIKNISNLGDAAIYCDFGSDVNKEVHQEVIKYFKTLKSKNIKGITNLAPSYNKLVITFDLDIINYKALREKIIDLKLDDINETVSEKKQIPICIDAWKRIWILIAVKFSMKTYLSMIWESGSLIKS